MLTIFARGTREASDLLDSAADHLDGDAGVFEELIDDVLVIEREWYSSLGEGSWRGLDLEVSGALRQAVTERGATGQRIEVQEARLIFGLEPSVGGPGLYGSILAARGLSAIADPSDHDAEMLAEDYLIALTGGIRR